MTNHTPSSEADRRGSMSLRIVISDEVKRIGIREVLRRLKISSTDLQNFLNGGPVDQELLATLQHLCPQYADLEHFLSCYFYEGYDYETSAYHKWEPAVDRFISGESIATLTGTAADIERMIIEFPNDADLLAALRRLGCRFSFRAARISPMEWLQGVSERINNATG